MKQEDGKSGALREELTWPPPALRAELADVDSYWLLALEVECAKRPVLRERGWMMSKKQWSHYSKTVTFMERVDNQHTLAQGCSAAVWQCEVR